MRAPSVPVAILAEVRDHAHGTIRPERESVGRLVVRDGMCVRYDRLRNWARGDGRFKVHRHRPQLDRGETEVLVHSHPSGYPRPSREDMKGANLRWLGVPYAILVMSRTDSGAERETWRSAPKRDRLRFFVLNHDRETYEVLS